MTQKMYKLVIPHSEITIGLPYGSVTLQNGQVLPEGDVTKSYPQYFKLIDDGKKKVAPKVEIIEKEVSVVEAPVVPEKRKAGRPKKQL